jgi:hypothetical protein
MKIVILFLFILAAFTNLYSYERLTLVERFTNASCAPCAALNNAWYNVTTQNLVNSGAISHLVYNVNWPGPNDPMYLLNSTDNMTRRSYYGVNWVPWPIINSVYFDYQTQGQTQFINAVNNGNAQTSPFQISIVQEAFSESMISFRVIVTRDPDDHTTFGNVKLRVALTETTVSFPSPPGSNGESHFYSICRKMLPNATGTTLTIPNPGESTEVLLEYVPTAQFIEAVNFDSIRVVAFIQDDNNKYIYQSYMHMLMKFYVASISAKSSDIIAEKNIAAQFTTSVRNDGLVDDSYTVQVTFEGPQQWTGEFTTSNGTFGFDQTDVINVAVGSTAEISVTVNPNGVNGFGITNIKFTSVNESGAFAIATLRNVTTKGIPLLVIDASEEGLGDFIYNSLGTFYSEKYAIVSRGALQNPGADISGFSVIAWSAGISLPVLTMDEVDMLQNFLDEGGRLFINGQDIGADIFEPTGQSQFAQDFYNNYLHASYQANSGPSFLIQGIDGNVISDGVLFFITDTYYARSADNILPFDNDAEPVLRFGNTAGRAGIMVESGSYRVVYFSIGIEQISDQAIIDTLVSRTINWLMEGVVLDVDDKGSSLVNTFVLNQNYPNPFNPTTTISYSIAGDSHVSIKIYDIMGAEVAELVNIQQPAGNYQVSFDASNLSSGIYFYRLNAGDYTSVKKMTLLK